MAKRRSTPTPKKQAPAKKPLRKAHPTLGWKATQLNHNVFELRIPFRANKDWEFWTLLTSDRHWDNLHSDWEMQRAHLEQAIERGAPVIDNGDFFCVMGGKYDKRSSKETIRPEHQRDDYLDALVETAADWFAPYAHHIVVIGSGNHEDAIRSRWETDLNQRLVALLNSQTGARVNSGSFSGWVRFAFTRDVKGRGTPVLWSKTLHYDHGYGGGGAVTKDIIQHERRAGYLDADIILTGHTHDALTYEDVRLGLTKCGTVEHREVLHVKCPTYKDEYGDGRGGWAVRKGHRPKPLGAWWLRFYWSHRHQRIQCEAIRAK